MIDIPIISNLMIDITMILTGCILAGCILVECILVRCILVGGFDLGGFWVEWIFRWVDFVQVDFSGWISGVSRYLAQ